MTAKGELGEFVNVDAPCIFPPHKAIGGSSVRLLPLQAEHAERLFESIGGEESASLYDYMPYGPFSELEPFKAHIAQLSKSKDPQFYVIADSKSDQLLGHLSFLRVDEKNRTIEIGHVLYARSLQRTTIATEVQYLLANQAFEHGFRRLEWKCNACNTASRRAALRFGYACEGVFRQHMIVKGRNRDSAWFSILDKEWPNRKKALEMWMAPDNFDEHGRQRRALWSLRTALG